MSEELKLRECPFCRTEMLEGWARYGMVGYAHPRNGCVLETFWFPANDIAAWNRRAPSVTRKEIAVICCPGLNCNDSEVKDDCTCDRCADAILALLRGE